VEYCVILEQLPDRTTFQLRAGVGWHEESKDYRPLSAWTDAEADYTLRQQEPLIIQDLRAETRFDSSPLLDQHGVLSSLSVIIPGQDRPFGVLEALSRKQRTFTQEDVHFLQAVAYVLTAAIGRQRAEEENQEASRRKDEFLAMLAHELRNPL